MVWGTMTCQHKQLASPLVAHPNSTLEIHVGSLLRAVADCSNSMQGCVNKDRKSLGKFFYIGDPDMITLHSHALTRLMFRVAHCTSAH